MQVKFKYAAISDIGLVRGNNEDNLFVPDQKIREPKKSVYFFNGEYTDNKSFFCVCDGMGGHSAGEVASYMAAQQVNSNYETIIENVKSSSDVRNVMKKFISVVNDNIYKTTEERPEYRSMGTTLTGIYFFGDKAYSVNIGDSRVYMLKNNKLRQLTEDHADSENKHALTRFLGMSSEYGTVYPDVADKRADIGMESRFLLCSDGLTDLVDDNMIRETLIKEQDPVEAAEKLVSIAKNNGGRDNITVLIIDAAPVSKAGAVVKNKAVIAGILALLMTAGAATYYQFHKPQSMGESLGALSEDIKNSHDLAEACHLMDTTIEEYDAKLSQLNDYCGSVDESDPDVASKNAELKEFVWQLSQKIQSLKDQYASVKSDNTMTDEVKHTQIVGLNEAIVSEIRQITEQCETEKEGVEKAVQEGQKRQEQKKNEEKRKSSSSNGSVKSSGGGSSSSKGSSGSGGSSSSKGSSGSGGSSSSSGGSSSGSSGSSSSSSSSSSGSSYFDLGSER